MLFVFYFGFRLLYCNGLVNWSNEWRMVVFSDEKTYYSTIKRAPKVKRKRGERYDQSNMVDIAQISSVKVNIWCFMSYNRGARAFLVSDNFNAREYIECIRTNFFNNHHHTDYIFQQDNCSIHKATEVIQFFRDHNVRTLNHPPISPDLNTCENIFNLSQRQLDHYLLTNFINNKTMLFNKVKEYIESIPVETVNSLIDSMPNRVQAVRVAGGGHTRY